MDISLFAFLLLFLHSIHCLTTCHSRCRSSGCQRTSDDNLPRLIFNLMQCALVFYNLATCRHEKQAFVVDVVSMELKTREE